jgi:small conductance mechanosensitive channel
MQELVDMQFVDRMLMQAQDIALDYGPKVIAALVIFVVGKWIARFLSSIAGKAMTRAGVDPILVGFGRNMIYIALFAFVVLAAVNQLGIQTTSFIAVMGAAGLAIGLALQGSLSNFAAGVMLVFFRPFKVGDFIEAGGTTGVVEEILLFTTRLRTGDNKQVFVPNGKIIDDVIVNYSGNETRRVDMVFGCGYGDDLRKARAVLEQIIADDDRILSTPAPVVAVSELADSSVNFVVRPWVGRADYWAVLWDFHEQVKVRFDEAGLNIPFPQRDVHVHQINEAA